MPELMVNVTRQRRASREKPQGAPAPGRGGGKCWEMGLHSRVKKDFTVLRGIVDFLGSKLWNIAGFKSERALSPLKSLSAKKRGLRSLCLLQDWQISGKEPKHPGAWAPRAGHVVGSVEPGSPWGFPESSPKDSLPPRTPLWNEPCLPWAVLPAAEVPFIN